ncbi:Ig-like domain-containing protein [Spirosoma litoris]
MISYIRVLICVLIVSLLCTTITQAQQLTITSVTPNPVCASSSITVSYSYTAGDPGTLLLYLNGPGTSDAFIGSTGVVSGGNGSMQGTIPADRTTGTYTVRLIRISGTSGAIVNSPPSSGFTVNALPTAPTVSNVAYCLGATGIPPLTATGTNLTWYPASTGGGGTTVAPTPPTSATGTTNYYVSQTVNGCEGPRATQQVTINPPPAKPTVVSSLSYCQNSTAPSLAAAVTSGSNLKWYSSALGGVGSTIAPTPSTDNAISTTYYVSQTNFSNQTDGSGCESDRAEITVTIKAAPAAPLVTTPVTYCQDAVASPLTATAISGGTLNWYGPSNNSLGSTAPTPPTSSPGTTYYYVSQTVSSCEGSKATIQVTVNTRPVAPTTTPVNVCQNTTPVSLATGITSGTNLRWYLNSTGGTGSTVAPSPATTTLGQTLYYVSQVDNNGCESDRAVLTFIVNGYPSAPTVNPNTLTYCQNATAASLTAITTPSPGGTLNFYLVSTGGTPYADLTPSTAASNNYYVSQTVKGCESTTRATISIIVNTLPAAPAVTTPVTYCQFTVAAPLSATAATNNTLYWYGMNSSGGSGSTTAPTPPTSADGTFFYYVSQKDPVGCEGSRSQISVIINAKPAAPAVTNASACLSAVAGSLVSSVTATGTLTWYTASSGGTGSTVAPTLSTTATGTTTYYVTQTSSSGCESDRAAITFTVNPLPPAPTVASPPSILYCQDVTAAALTATGTNLKWYTASGTLLSNPVIPLTNVAGAISYYVSQTDGYGCESARTEFTVVTASRPVPPTVSATPVVYCQYDTPVSLTATALPGNTLVWYGQSETGGTASTGSGFTIPTTDPAVSTRYYVSQKDGNNCESSTRSFITVTVNAKPAAPTTTSITLCQNASTVSLQTGVTSGSNLKWYDAQTGGTMYTGTPVLSTSAVGSTTYYVSQTSGDGCESDRSAVVVTVKPLPVAPTVTPNPQLLCQSSVPSPLTAIATGTLRWYDSGGNVYTSVTPSTNAVGPQSYSVSQIVDGCEGPRAALNIVVIAKPVVPTVTSSIAACQLSTPVALTASGTNLKWYADATTTATIPTPTPSTNTPGPTTYYVTQTDANGCESDRASILVQIKPKPNAPGTAPVSFCSNQVTALTATFDPGTTPNWYGQNPASTPITTATIPTTAVIGASINYYVSQTLDGCESDQAAIAVTIKALPVAPTVSTTPVLYCQDATAAPLSATAVSGGTLNWYTVSTGGSASSTAPIPPTTSGTSLTTYYYVSQTVDGCEGPRATIAVTINPRPVAPTVTVSLSYCQNTTAPILSATAPGTLKWYADPTTTTVIPTPTPSTTTAGTTSYYVTQTDVNGCESNRASVTVTIIATPTAPITTTATFCQDATPVALTATTSPGGTLNWYTSSVGGVPTSTAPFPPTSATGTTTYYVSQSINGCEGPRASLDVVVLPRPVAPTVSTNPLNYCQNAVSVPLSATASTGATLNWYTVPTGGTSSSVAPTPSTSGTGSTIYYVSQTVNGCEGPQATITVTIKPLPAAPSISSSTVNFCQGTVATTLSATPSPGGILNWYTVPTDGTPSATAPTPPTSTPGITIYYVSQTVNGCEGPRVAITVTITATPGAPGTSAISYCLNAVSAPLTAVTSLGGTLNWYINPTGGVSTPIAPSPPTSTAGGLTYYVSQSVSGCEGPRASVAVTIKSLPSAPGLSASALSYCQNTTSAPLTAIPSSGGTLNWYTVPVNGSPSQTAPTPPTSAVGILNYYVSQTVNGCEGDRVNIAVTIKALPTAPGVATAPIVYCQGVIATALTASPASGGSLNWYTTQTGGVASSIAPIPPTTSPGYFTYYVSQTVNGCEGPMASITVIIQPTPPAPTVGNAPIYCQGGPATALSAVATSGGTLSWYTTPTGGTGSAIPPVPPVTAAGTATYYVSQNVNGCEGPRVSLVATIKASPSVPAVTASPTYCQNAVAAPLTATPNGGVLNWYTASSGGSASSIAPVPPTTTPGTQVYYVSQTDANGCESNRAPVTVKINPLPVAPSVTPATFCQGSVATALVATPGSGGSLNWYTTPTGGTSTPLAPTPVTTNSGALPYYVSQTDINGCESPRSLLLVTITAMPAPPVFPAIAPVCQNSTPFVLAAAGQSLKWYADATTTASLGSAVTQTTTVPGTFVYYVSQTVNSCESARATAQVVVNPLPAAPAVAANQNGCQDAIVQPLTATGTALQWYDGNDNLISPPTPVTKVDITQSYSYKVTQTINGCTSPKATINYVVNVTPLPTVVSPIAFCQNTTPRPLTASGTNLKWTDPTGAVTTNAPTPPTTVVSAGTSYSVTQTSVLGCESRKAEIRVTINSASAAKLEGTSSIYLGNSAVLTLTLSGVGPYSYTLSDGTTGTAETAPNGEATVRKISVTPAASTTYAVTAVANACGNGAVTGGATVTVKVPTIATNALSTSVVCTNTSFVVPFSTTGEFVSGNAFTVEIASATGDSASRKYTPISNGVVQSGGISTSIPGTFASGQYYVRVTALNAPYPILGTRSPTLLTVRAAPTASISATNNVIFSGQSTELNFALTGEAPWTVTYSNGTQVAAFGTNSNVFSTTVTPTTTTTYKLLTVSNGCGSGKIEGVDTVRVRVDVLTAEEDLLSNSVKVYPVPTDGAVTVDIDLPLQKEAAQLQLVGPGGTVFEQITTKKRQTQLDLNKEPAGTYLLHITIGDKSTVRKILKL